MTDTASESRSDTDDSPPHGEESSAGPIPVADWLEQAFTISDSDAQTENDGETTTMATADDAVLEHGPVDGAPANSETADEHTDSAPEPAIEDEPTTNADEDELNEEHDVGDEAEAGVEVEVDGEPEAGVEVDGEPEAGVEVEVDGEPEAGVEVDGEAEADDAEADDGAEAGVEVDDGPEAGVEVDDGPEAGVEVDDGPEAGVEVDGEPEVGAEADNEAGVDVDDNAVLGKEMVSEQPAGFHEDVDDTSEGKVLVGALPARIPAGSASDDYSAVVHDGGRSGRHYRRRSIVSALVLALALIALGGAAGYVIALYLPDKWTAEAEVVLDPGTASVDRHLATQQVLMESSAILDRAVEELPVDRDYVEEELKIFPIEASTALGINFIDPDPELAQDVVAAVLVSFMTEVDVASVDFSTPIYRQRIEDLMAQRQVLEDRLRGLEAANAEAEANEQALPYPAEVRRMALESEQLLAQISSLQDAIVTQEVADLERTDATVVTEPRVLTEPTWPNPLVFTALGLLVGLVVAATALFLLASRRVG